MSNNYTHEDVSMTEHPLAHDDVKKYRSNRDALADLGDWLVGQIMETTDCEILLDDAAEAAIHFGLLKREEYDPKVHIDVDADVGDFVYVEVE